MFEIFRNINDRNNVKCVKRNVLKEPRVGKQIS